MKAFGIELRKANSIQGLLSDVDQILLANNTLPSSGGVSISFKAQSCVVALQKMFRGERSFSVCTINDCAKMFDLVIPRERMDIYRAVHCVNWNEMDSQYRQTLTALILDDFRDVLQMAA